MELRHENWTTILDLNDDDDDEDDDGVTTTGWQRLRWWHYVGVSSMRPEFPRRDNQFPIGWLIPGLAESIIIR